MRSGFILILSFALCSVLSADADGPPAPLTTAAVQASEAGRYCDALALFEASNARWPSARALYNAAEVANAAGDRWRAIELYREAQRLYPEYERQGVMQKRLDDLGRRVAKEGPGRACARTPNRCGDWRIDGRETCDDGNAVDGNAANGDTCDSNCQVTSCGNGIKTEGEACDDGNLVSGDLCDANCTPTACGNAVTTPGEQCDDGNTVDGDGCDSTCTKSACGNGVRTGVEQCDDGNQKDGDGCDEGCVVTRCGNGVLTRGEVCDDGNSIDGDGCDAGCRITQVHAPLPGILVAASGVAGGAAAGGLFWAAGYQWLDHQEAVRAIDVAEERYASDPDESLRIVRIARDREESARVAWNGWGKAAIGGGVALSVASVAAIGGGVWWAITRTEDWRAEDEDPK